jgi:hypothetical protein
VLSPRVVIPSLIEESLPSEKIVLGSVLMDPQRLSEVTATGSDFTKQHQPVFDAMLGPSPIPPGKCDCEKFIGI